MKIQPVESLSDLEVRLSGSQKSWLLIYKSGTGQSDCAMANLASTEEPEGFDSAIFTADVNIAGDIHPKYGIDSAPVLLELEGDRMVNLFKGCNSPGFYSRIFSGGEAVINAGHGKSSPRRVTLYTTPTCSWCTTLKNYLKDNRVQYREIDVSSDRNAAEEMVRKSGQQGVPQTDINGEMIIGFDRARIDKLLGIGR